MTSPTMERLLWRWQYGQLDAQVLEFHLRDAIDRAEDEEVEWSAAARALATVASPLAGEHTEARREARRALDRHQFQDAVRELHRCRAATAAMRALCTADTDAAAAEDTVEALHQLVPPQRLRALPSLAALACRTGAIRVAMLEERYEEASIEAKLCNRLGQRLLDVQQPDKARRDALRAQIRELGSLCTATQAWATSEDDPIADGTLAALRSVLDGGRFLLADRLATELAIELGPRQRFRTAQPLIRDDVAAARETVRERSWDGAVDHYWHLSIARHAGRLTREQQRATAAGAALTSAIQTSDRST